MTTDCFIERILDEFEATSACKPTDSEMASARDFITADIPATDRDKEISRKMAAVVVHRSLQRLTGENDDDWGPARFFKDIYDCRVCANAVAQVTVKGIIEPESSDVFGMNGSLSEEAAHKTIVRIFNPSERITVLLGLDSSGNS